MQKTILYALFLFLVTGLLFSACTSEEPQSGKEVDVQLDLKSGQAEEVIIEEVTVEEEDYDDGTYTKIGTYSSPAGQESIAVTLTIDDDTVTNVSIQKNAVNEKSINYQTLFADGISALVVGKKLEEIAEFSSVNGSSLTPRAFQDALELIKIAAENGD